MTTPQSPQPGAVLDASKRTEIAGLIALHGLGTTTGNPREKPNDAWSQEEWERRILEVSPIHVEERCYALADAIFAILPPAVEPESAALAKDMARAVGGKTEAVLERDGFFVRLSWIRMGREATVRIYEPYGMRLSPALADLLAHAIEEPDPLRVPAVEPEAPAGRDEAGEALARRFHETYERLAPSFGYETRADTKAFDPDSPNGRLMIAVCSALSAPTRQPEAESGAVAWVIMGNDFPEAVFLSEHAAEADIAKRKAQIGKLPAWQQEQERRIYWKARDVPLIGAPAPAAGDVERLITTLADDEVLSELAPTSRMTFLMRLRRSVLAALGQRQ